MRCPIAITMGDPAGIGPEIVAKAFRDAPELTRGCFVAGDVATMRRAALAIAGPDTTAMAVRELTQAELAHDLPLQCMPVLQVTPTGQTIAMGMVSAAAGRMAADSVVWAADAALRGAIAAMVTAPLHKESLSAAGPPYGGFPGHTEMLQHRAAMAQGVPIALLPVRMMLANDVLRTVLVSIHVSMRDAIDAVTCANVLETITITDKALQSLLGRRPRIAVAGLNPHAGEGGLFGREELDAITPAIDAARALGMDVSGPIAPDTVFMRARARNGTAGEWDVVVAMYHDQGLIPVKYLGVDTGVNVTLGLPLIRTSPDHGTAFDIAGAGTADPSSLCHAIRMARDLVALPVARD